MGVYPLLADETCWFLAADFDKSSWKEDVAAFNETCGTVGVPVAIERSRSGNGAHAWFFFDVPVSANVARPDRHTAATRRTSADYRDAAGAGSLQG